MSYEERRKRLIAREGEERRKALAPQRGNGELPNLPWIYLLMKDESDER